MSEYTVNRGIGNEVEFKGLRAQYLFLFAGGLLASFILFVILYVAGTPTWICIVTILIAMGSVLWLTFTLNRKYGTHGLMKLSAIRRYPRRIIRRKRISRMVRIRIRFTFIDSKTP